MNSVAKIQWLLNRIKIVNQEQIGARKARIVRLLNKEFRHLDSDFQHARYVGSFGRGTAIRGVSDIDLLFEMPRSVYIKYNRYSSNGQSALLQAVKNCLQRSISTTDMAGDGQVVVVNFIGMHFDVLPVFKTDVGNYIFPDTHDNGSWQECDPVAEIQTYNLTNLRYSGKLKRLSQLARAWREINNVPISGFLIDTLAYQFLSRWPDNTSKGYVSYPDMLSDFFDFLGNQNREQNYWMAPGSGQRVWRDGTFETKADRAYLNVVNAIACDKRARYREANEHWKSLFGRYFQGTL